jgi:hypothetical protein
MSGTADESRAEIVEWYRRAWDHSGATVDALDIDAPGYVPWWPRPNVVLFDVLVHMLNETNRHAGHAEILREQLDGGFGFDEESSAHQGQDAVLWANHRTMIERAANTADRHRA